MKIDAVVHRYKIGEESAQQHTTTIATYYRDQNLNRSGGLGPEFDFATAIASNAQ